MVLGASPSGSKQLLAIKQLQMGSEKSGPSFFVFGRARRDSLTLIFTLNTQ